MPMPLIVLLLSLSIATGPVWAQLNTEAINAMEEYLDFVDYGGATIFPEQIPAVYPPAVPGRGRDPVMSVFSKDDRESG